MVLIHHFYSHSWQIEEPSLYLNISKIGLSPDLGDLQLLGSTQFFAPYRHFPLITLLLGMLYCLFFKAWKTIDSLMCVPNFLFRDVYSSLLFNFKIGPSLDLSFLMSPIFIIILIIYIIKTTCFDDTILMVELEGKLP